MKINANGYVYLQTLRNDPGNIESVPLKIGNNNELVKGPSSRRYKENITDIEIDTSKIYDLRPVSFDYIASGRRDFGLIAEEVNETLPELVVHNIEGQIESVKYDQLPTLLLAELKRLRERTITLETRITELENTLSTVNNNNNNNDNNNDNEDSETPPEAPNED
jgi:hypothetical protein